MIVGGYGGYHSPWRSCWYNHDRGRALVAGHGIALDKPGCVQPIQCCLDGGLLPPGQFMLPDELGRTTIWPVGASLRPLTLKPLEGGQDGLIGGSLSGCGNTGTGELPRRDDTHAAPMSNWVMLSSIRLTIGALMRRF